MINILGIGSFNALGRCMRCMQMAFLSSAVAWTVAVIVAAIAPGFIPLGGLVLLASALTLLWLAHLSAYAARSVSRATAENPANRDGGASSWGRREILKLFAGSFAAVALASAFSFSAGPASAQSTCPSQWPHACGTEKCCSVPSKYFCEGYSGSVPNWRNMGTFCTNDDTAEAVADLRSNCAVFIYC